MNRRLVLKAGATLPFLAALPSVGIAGTHAPAASPLNDLLDASLKAHSGVLIVSVAGKRVAQAGELPKERHHAMSITKPVAGLAIAHLIQTGKISSLDAPVSQFLPVWANDPAKKLITLRQVVSHTTGLADDATAMPVYDAKNCVEYALAAPVAEPAGKVFLYNNRAANLVSGIVQAASGLKLDAYLNKHIFGPMGIRQADWQSDPSGTPYAMTGFVPTGDELAAIGEMLVAGGVARNGKRVLDAATVARYVRPIAAAGAAPTDGIFWFDAQPSGGFVIDDAGIAKLSPRIAPETTTWLRSNIGKRYAPPQTLVEALRAALPKEVYSKDVRLIVDDLTYEEQPSFGYFHSGDSGQYLVMVPEKRLVIARMIDQPVAQQDARARVFLDFKDKAAAYAKSL